MKNNNLIPYSLSYHLYKIVFETDTLLGKLFDLIIITLILLSLSMVILVSYDSIYTNNKSFFDNLEYFIVIIFSIEYVFRLALCDLPIKISFKEKQEKYTLKHFFKNKLDYIIKPMSIVDILAIAPFYLRAFGLLFDLRILRIVRIFRLFRIFKLARYTRALEILGVMVKERGRIFIVLFLIIFVGVLLLANAIHIYEKDAARQMDDIMRVRHVKYFGNIPKTLWWCFLYIGQGGTESVMPVTIEGRTITSIMILVFRLGIVCIFGGIFAASFIERVIKLSSQSCPNKNCGLKRIQANADYCPLCGTSLSKLEDCCKQNPLWANYCHFCGKNLKNKIREL